MVCAGGPWKHLEMPTEVSQLKYHSYWILTDKQGPTSTWVSSVRGLPPPSASVSAHRVSSSLLFLGLTMFYPTAMHLLIWPSPQCFLPISVACLPGELLILKSHVNDHLYQENFSDKFHNPPL